MTIYEHMKEIVNDREQFAKNLIENGFYDILLNRLQVKICDTIRCPYLEKCKESGKCEISDEEYIDILLDMEVNDGWDCREKDDE